MKKCLIIFVTLFYPIVSIAQIENFSWLISRNGFSNAEFSDVYADGSVISAGNFITAFDVDPGSNEMVYTPTQAVGATFVQKLKPDGSLDWAKEYNGGSGSLQIQAMCVDVSGNAFFTGSIQGNVDFDPSTPGYELSSSYIDLFLLSLDRDGNFRWVRKLGSGGINEGTDVQTDFAGNVYLFGSLDYDNSDFNPGSGVNTLPTRTGYASFVEKLSTNGEFVWAKRTIGRKYGRIKVDNQANVFVLNDLDGTAVTSTGDTLNSGINSDLVIQKFDANGETVWTRSYGNTPGLGLGAIAIDKDFNLYILASFAGLLNVDPGNSELIISAEGSYDAFIQKLSNDGAMMWTKSIRGTGTTFARGIAISPDGHIHVVGEFVGDVDFEPTISEDDLNASGSSDGFMAKFNLDGQYVESFGFGSMDHDDNGLRIHCDSNNNVILHGSHDGEFTLSTNMGDRVVFGNGNHFILKLGDPAILTENYLYIGLSPNPVENIVSINQLEGSQFAQVPSAIDIRIYDDMGRIIIETTSNTAHTEIDLSNFGSGAYLIEVVRGDDRFMERVVKIGKVI